MICESLFSLFKAGGGDEDEDSERCEISDRKCTGEDVEEGGVRDK